MAESKIENLQMLISQYASPNKTIATTQIRPLTLPGENYLSIMLEVNLTLKNSTDESEEPFHAVAKCMDQGMGGPGAFSYHNEVVFYKDLLPTIDKFRQDEGAPEIKKMFPELYAYRPNAHGNNEDVDQNAVILLENLSTTGENN